MAPQTDKGVILAKSKRIASNSLLLFLRMFAIMVINLYAVRIILCALGELDYGIFNAVAGIVLTSSFLTITLAASIQRFYSYSLGAGAEERLRDIFSASVNIILGLTVLVFILFELGGQWFVVHYLIEPSGKIPVARYDAALWVFQFSLLSFLLTMFQIPYTAAVFAHEDMGIFALVSFMECLARLGVALLVGQMMVDGLMLYGTGLFVVSLLACASYVLICRHRYPECHYHFRHGSSVYRNLLSFSGWTMYGTLAGVSMIQGSTILLNIFFGPVTNAAYAVANQVYNAAAALCNSLVVAFRPAMVKSYAEHQFSFLNQLFDVSNKSVFYLLLCALLPLAIEIRQVFGWWLNGVSEETVVFSRLFLVYLMCLSLNRPITTIVESTGRVRNYFLLVESLMLMCLPFSYVFFRLGLPSYFVFVAMITGCVIAHLVRLLCLRRLYSPFSLRLYFISFLFPGSMVAVLSLLLTLQLHSHISSPLSRFFIVGLCSPLMTLVLAYFLGLTHSERRMFKEFARPVIIRVRSWFI